MAEEGMELGDGIPAKAEKTSVEVTLITNHSDKPEIETMVEMELIYDEENPVKDEVMEDTSEGLSSIEEQQSSLIKPTSSVKKKSSKSKRISYLEKIVRLNKRQSHSYENYIMALKLKSLELDSKIKESVLKKCKLDITLTKMERQIKEYKLRKMELDLAKSKLEYAVLQSRNRSIT